MTRVATAAIALVFAIAAGWPETARAQDLNPHEKTFLTFSTPVELPELSLPAGTYTFKLADTPGRNVVQVFSRDESKLHGQFLFRQTERRDASGETVVMFAETAAGSTPAVKYWFYPNERIGKEFVYPKDQAVKIAARTHQPVLASEGDSIFTVDEKGNRVEDKRDGKPATAQPPGK